MRTVNLKLVEKHHKLFFLHPLFSGQLEKNAGSTSVSYKIFQRLSRGCMCECVGETDGGEGGKRCSRLLGT